MFSSVLLERFSTGNADRSGAKKSEKRKNKARGVNSSSRLGAYWGVLSEYKEPSPVFTQCQDRRTVPLSSLLGNQYNCSTTFSSFVSTSTKKNRTNSPIRSFRSNFIGLFFPIGHSGS